MLKIVTLNLLNDLTYWEKRAPLILQNLQELEPDLVAMQEVALPENNAAWFADQLGGYSTYLCPKTNGRGRKEGLAILSRLPVQLYDTLALGAQNRVAQRVIVQKDKHRWMFVNTHLFWSPFDDPVRVQQVQLLLNWVPQQLHAVICGDFNSMPEYRAIRVIKRRMNSAYESAHGHEPEHTYPTPLKRGPGLRHSARRAAMQVAGRVLDTPCDGWCGTVDYIFISRPVQVNDCQVVFTKPSLYDGNIYPSDHMGLSASLNLSDED